MSDTSQGQGWWLASDGKWYPPGPEDGAVRTAPPPPAAGADQAPAVGWWRAADGKWYPPPAGFSGDVPGKKPLHRRVWFWVLLIVALGLSGCVAVGSVIGVAVDHVAHVKHTIVYSVTGTGSATSISYETLQEGNGHNGDEHLANVPLPWSRTIVASGLVTVYGVQATTAATGGSATCTITDNGALVSSHTVTGALKSVNCIWGG
jgi:hypothetical protein